jgi:hypothetical protein
LNLLIVSIYSCVCAYFPSWNKQHSMLMETFLLTGGAKLLNKTRISEWYYSYLHENWQLLVPYIYPTDSTTTI